MKTLHWVLRILFVTLVGLAKGQDTTRLYTNGIGMEFVRIEPGKMTVGKFQPPYPVREDTIRGAVRPFNMWMGDGRSYNEIEFRLAKELALRDASDGFEVTISKPFYLARYEVTQRQWKMVMGNNPSAFQGDENPVENISWKDARKFIDWLNKMEGRNVYRLPTEFEWEYAARAGAEGDILWNETTQVAQLGTTTTQPVGKKDPNGWGLYDMLGNVWEWVADRYNGKIFADPTPPSRGKVHVLKGASFVGDVKNATWLTHAGGPGNGWDVGFRVLMDIE